jgi:ABC-2 type transport system permease protein
MRLPSILAKTLSDLRWQVFWYGVGFALMAAMMVFVYPSYHGQLADLEIPEAFKALIGEADYGTPNGFLTAEFFSWIYIMGIVFALMAGTSALGGEESAGTLDLLLAQPISRRRLAVEKMLGVAVSSALISLVACAGWLLSVPFVEIDVSYGKLIAATFLLVPLMTCFAALSMLCAAWLPERRVATGVATAIAVACFVADFIGTLVDAVAPVRWASFIFYYRGTNPLIGSTDLFKLAVLILSTAVFAVLAVVAFERREVGVNLPVRLPFHFKLRSAA